MKAFGKGNIGILVFIAIQKNSLFVSFVEYIMHIFLLRLKPSRVLDLSLSDM